MDHNSDIRRDRIDVINAAGEKVSPATGGDSTDDEATRPDKDGGKPTGRAGAHHGSHFADSSKTDAGAAAGPDRTVRSAPVVPPSAYVGNAGGGSAGDGGKGKSRKRGGSRKKPVAIAVGVVCAVYLLGVAVFSNVFMPNTTVNGEDVSLRSASSVGEEAKSSMADYTLSVSGDNVSLDISGNDIDLSANADNFASDAMSQVNAWAWPIGIFTGNDITCSLSTSYDEDKLSTLVSAAVDEANADATQPTNATMTYDDDKGEFVIQDEEMGTAVDADAVVKAVSTAISEGQTSLELGDDQLVQPTVTSDSEELSAAVDTANKYVKATQTLTANGETVATVDSSQIAQWVTLGDDLSVGLDTDAITSWASGDLASSLNTVGTSRTYTRADGETITVSGGTYGWSVDADSLASTISENIQAAESATFDVPWSTTAAEWNPGGADWGTRYIDVDLSEQHARFYDNGEIIWESDFVSGDTTEDHATPEGVYQVNDYKGTNQTLKGLDEDGDGEPDYTSHVTYWIPFIDNLVAFHDATWRSSFGGTIYQGNGSHGCINLPYSAAEELYSLAEVGDVVVVHS